MINTIADQYFKEHPEKIIGDIAFGFRGRIEVTGNEKTIKLYFNKGISSNDYIENFNLPEKADVKNSNSETLDLIAILELIDKSDRDPQTEDLLQVLKLSL